MLADRELGALRFTVASRQLDDDLFDVLVEVKPHPTRKQANV
jgi:hypothetical protein